MSETTTEPAEVPDDELQVPVEPAPTEGTEGLS